MEPYFAQHGVSGSQWAVLRNLRRAEDEGLTGLRLTDLGERLLVRPPSMTGVVDRLQRMGMVLRTPSETDLRTKYVSLTDAGRRLVNGAREGQVARIKTILDVLSQQEQGELQAKLDKIANHIETLIERGEAPKGNAPAELGEGEE
jgi:DNA-binding MarR family transcriptional regulator